MQQMLEQVAYCLHNRYSFERRFAIVANQQKLHVVDMAQSIRRHACQHVEHILWRFSDVDHHFHGLCFVHPELAAYDLADRPEFAGFVSSLIESGTNPSLMGDPTATPLVGNSRI